MPGVVQYQVKRCHTLPAATPCCHQAGGGECAEVKATAPEVKVVSCDTCGDRPQPRTPLVPRPPTVRRVEAVKDSSAQTGCCAPGAADRVIIATPRPVTTCQAPPTADECGGSRDHFHRPSPRLVKSVQPPRPQTSRPCSCTCHSTVVRRHMRTPQATPTSYLAEAEARLAASVCEGDLTTRNEPGAMTSSERQGQGQGELCWRCKLQQCYQCGLELPPDPKIYRQPVLRVGRQGAPWRHVKGVTTSNGVYYSFVDGVVKTDDARYYPPYGYIPGYMQQQQGGRRPICLCGGCQGCVCAKKALTSSSYYSHAKTGFRFWFDDRRPKPKTTAECGQGHYRPRYLNTWC